MKRILRKVKGFLLTVRDSMLLRYRISSCSGTLEKPLKILNSKYINIGSRVRIKKGARIECYDSFYGQSLFPSLNIEDGVIIGYNFSCLVADKVEIGKDTIFASDVLITSENHGMNPESNSPYHAQPLSTGEVTIGQGCWIGEKVSIISGGGVRIGDKCIIAAGAVVTKDIPDYSIAGGIPARVIKRYDFEKHMWQ